MSIYSEIKENIKKIEKGKIIDINNFFNDKLSKKTVLKSFERLVKLGKIRRAERGVYYIPKESIFGELPLSKNELLKKYLYEREDTVVGYLSGNNLFNKYGLTTQIANEIEITTNKRKNPKKYGDFTIKFNYNEAPINKENIKYLEILDILKNIKYILDTDIKESYRIIKKIILKFSDDELAELIELANRYYPARVIALLGSIIENEKNIEINKLKEKLNKNTRFNLGLDLPSLKEWGIR